MKRIFIILGSVLGIVLVVLFFLYLQRAWVLSSVISSKMGSTVILESIQFSEGKTIFINNLSIDNPDGYHSTHALEVASTLFSAPYRNYFQEIINIDAIVLDEIMLTVDLIGKKTNWEKLMQQLDERPSYERTESYAVINTLSFKRLRVRISKDNNVSQVYELKDITLHNVYTKKGELTRRVTQAILAQIIANLQGIINIPMNFTEETLDLLNPFSKPRVGQ